MFPKFSTSLHQRKVRWNHFKLPASLVRMAVMKQTRVNVLAGVQTSTVPTETRAQRQDHMQVWHKYTPVGIPQHTRDTCTVMITAVLFKMTKKWNQPRCLSTDEWREKKNAYLWMEFYVDLEKKNKTWHFIGKWLKRQLLLSKICQTQKYKYNMFPFMGILDFGFYLYGWHTHYYLVTS